MAAGVRVWCCAPRIRARRRARSRCVRPFARFRPPLAHRDLDPPQDGVNVTADVECARFDCNLLVPFEPENRVHVVFESTRSVPFERSRTERPPDVVLRDDIGIDTSPESVEGVPRVWCSGNLCPVAPTRPGDGKATVESLRDVCAGHFDIERLEFVPNALGSCTAGFDCLCNRLVDVVPCRRWVCLCRRCVLIECRLPRYCFLYPIYAGRGEGCLSYWWASCDTQNTES